MAQSKLKVLVEEEAITASTTLYRIGNLRILVANGTSPHGNILAKKDRPSAQIVGSGDAADSGGNLSDCIGRLTVAPNGVISCTYLSSYNNPSAGFGTLAAPNTIYATAVWVV